MCDKLSELSSNKLFLVNEHLSNVIDNNQLKKFLYEIK